MTSIDQWFEPKELTECCEWYIALKKEHHLHSQEICSKAQCDDVKRRVTKESHYEELKISKVSRVCLKEQDFVCHKPF